MKERERERDAFKYKHTLFAIVSFSIIGGKSQQQQKNAFAPTTFKNYAKKKRKKKTHFDFNSNRNVSKTINKCRANLIASCIMTFQSQKSSCDMFVCVHLGNTYQSSSLISSSGFLVRFSALMRSTWGYSLST